MVKISWSILADEDLQEIEEFISLDSQTYAMKTIEKLQNRVIILISFPESGRIVPELNDPDIRELIEGNYRIVYFIKDNANIVILRVHHTSQLIR